MKVSRLFLPSIFGTLMALVFLFGAEWQVTDTARAAMPVQADLQVVIRYVAPTGSDTTDCTNSANPCATIQYAVDQAGVGDEVRVAGGEYTDVHTRTEYDPHPPNEILTQTVFISHPLTLRGGYTLTNWAVSDPVAHPTTIDPQGQGRGIFVVNATGAVVENLRVVNGTASGFYLGGGIGVAASEVTIIGCWIEGHAGSGVGVEASTLILQNNVITGNTSSQGAGVYGMSSLLTVTQNTVSWNEAINGGGIYLDQSHVYLAENTISHNSVSQNGGGSYIVNGPRAIVVGNTFAENTAMNRGGGAILGNDSTLEVFENTFIGNSSGQDGGGLFLGGHGAVFHNNLVLDNTAEVSGGGINANGVNLTLSSNEIRGNYSNWDGGGLFLTGSQHTLSANSILSNTALAMGGGVLVISYDSTSLVNNLVANNQIVESWELYDGSGIYLQGGTATLLNNTVANNHGGDNNGIFVRDGSYTMTNNIIVSHTVGLEVFFDGIVQTEATLWGNQTDWVVTNGTITTGIINLYGDPSFIDPANGDYHLNPNSLAIDAGIDSGVTTDIDGDTRPFGAGFDIGADELSTVVRYVATTGSDTTNCTDSANPCATIQYAVDQAGVGDEVRVAGGEYTDVHIRSRMDNATTGVVTQVVYISKTIDILGGYTITNWINSVPENNPTILNAQGQGRGIYITGEVSPTINGLRVTGGESAGLGGGFWPWYDAGAGIYSYDANSSVVNTEIFSNTSSLQYGNAGGLYASYGNITILNSSFYNNFADSRGGGILLHFTNAEIISATIRNNQAIGNYGGIGVSSSHTRMSNAIIENNHGYNGGLSVSGGEFTLLDSFIISNTGTGGGGINLDQVNTFTATNNVIMNNTSSSGGGISAFQSNFILESNLIINNVSESVGGGIAINDILSNFSSHFVSRNNIIANNHANFSGSAISAHKNYPTGNTSIELINTTIAQNTGGNGVGIGVGNINLWMTNTILVSHTIGISTTTFDSTAYITATATLWDNEINWTGDITITTGTINLYGDPSFIDPAHGNYHLNPDSLAIDAGIDAGVTTDIDGDARPLGAGFDIGADEFVISLMGSVTLPGRTDHSGAVVAAWVGETVVATTTTDSGGAYFLFVPEGVYTITIEMPLYLDAVKANIVILNTSPTILASVTLLGGDANESDKINIFDLSLIGSHYGLTCADPGWDPRADVNGDCVINLLDLTLAAANFGKTSPVVWE